LIEARMLDGKRVMREITKWVEYTEINIEDYSMLTKTAGF